jgi:hypothetical protein
MKTNTKTNKQNKTENKNQITEELQNRSEQLSGKNNTNAQPEIQTAKTPEKDQSEPEPEQTPTKSTRPYVNFQERDHNRRLPLEKVLAALKRWMPRQYELAEVVGKWIWITFPEQPIERVRADLAQLGFHWNNTRKCWQHPCGETLPRGQQEPREKYDTYFPADRHADGQTGSVQVAA